jgi:hypothetical protein
VSNDRRRVTLARVSASEWRAIVQVAPRVGSEGTILRANSGTQFVASSMTIPDSAGYSNEILSSVSSNFANRPQLFNNPSNITIPASGTHVLSAVDMLAGKIHFKATDGALTLTLPHWNTMTPEFFNYSGTNAGSLITFMFSIYNYGATSISTFNNGTGTQWRPAGGQVIPQYKMAWVIVEKDSDFSYRFYISV